MAWRAGNESETSAAALLGEIVHDVVRIVRAPFPRGAAAPRSASESDTATQRLAVALLLKENFVPHLVHACRCVARARAGASRAREEGGVRLCASACAHSHTHARSLTRAHARTLPLRSHRVHACGSALVEEVEQCAPPPSPSSLAERENGTEHEADEGGRGYTDDAAARRAMRSLVAPALSVIAQLVYLSEGPLFISCVHNFLFAPSFVYTLFFCCFFVYLRRRGAPIRARGWHRIRQALRRAGARATPRHGRRASPPLAPRALLVRVVPR